MAIWRRVLRALGFTTGEARVYTTEAELGVKENTIKAQVKGALRKFEVHSRGELRAILEEMEEGRGEE